jgi:Flp pilus assembly protein TadD
MSFRGLGQLDKATVYIGKAVELQPGNSVHLNNYGVILAESGRIEEAKAQWRKVLRLEPDNEVAKQNLSAIDG